MMDRGYVRRSGFVSLGEALTVIARHFVDTYRRCYGVTIRLD